MFERVITIEEVKKVIRSGEKVQSYPDDQPYPSYLVLHYIQKRPLHVVVAFNSEIEDCIVITAYEPSLNRWESDFKTRKN